MNGQTGLIFSITYIPNGKIYIGATFLSLEEEVNRLKKLAHKETKKGRTKLGTYLNIALPDELRTNILQEISNCTESRLHLLHTLEIFSANSVHQGLNESYDPYDLFKTNKLFQVLVKMKSKEQPNFFPYRCYFSNCEYVCDKIDEVIVHSMTEHRIFLERHKLIR